MLTAEVGPLRHSVRRGYPVAFGSEADMTRTPQIGRS